MTVEYKYILNISEGVGKIQGRKQFEADCRQLGNAKMLLTMKRYKAKRSLSQNSYYHGAILPAVRQGLIDMGFDHAAVGLEAVHELLKAKFLKRDIANDDGQFITVTLSTADLNKTEFGEYIDAIDRWSLEFLGFNLPTPNTQQQINY